MAGGSRWAILLVGEWQAACRRSAKGDDTADGWRDMGLGWVEGEIYEYAVLSKLAMWGDKRAMTNANSAIINNKSGVLSCCFTELTGLVQVVAGWVREKEKSAAQPELMILNTPRCRNEHRKWHSIQDTCTWFLST